MIYKQFIMINSITFQITFKTEENYDFTLRLFSSVQEVFVHTVDNDKFQITGTYSQLLFTGLVFQLVRCI